MYNFRDLIWGIVICSKAATEIHWIIAYITRVYVNGIYSKLLKEENLYQCTHWICNAKEIHADFSKNKDSKNCRFKKITYTSK